jgi:beta-glucosidase
VNGRADFPNGFLWGAATSAYQIEGATDEDGRGESIWDTFCATPGKVHNGDSGAIACDSYHRYRLDIALMRELGLNAFRFSIAWPRIVPDGRGRVNEPGLDFYDRLVDELLAADIRPFVTLYHWDLPQALEDAGGWPERATAEAFAEYAELVARRLGDRVRHWVTHNEPYCSSWLGYAVGAHAPGRTDPAAAVPAAHHVLLSHGLAVEVLRRESPDAEVGIVLDSWPVYPLSDDPRDVEAAWEADGFRNRLFFDPVLRGQYPEDVLERLGATSPPIRDGDLATIAEPIDFVGLNNYSRTIVAANGDGGPRNVPATDAPMTAMGWEIYPHGIYEVLARLHREYGVSSLYVTENGAAFPDVRGHDGRIDDPERIEYLAEYLGAVSGAIADGVPVHGYFVWSLLDNFEWSHGYSKRFGLLYVDFPTLERIPKSSFYWYRDLIGAGRLPVPEPTLGAT